MPLDFTNVQTAAKFASEVNEGYSACLRGSRLINCPYFPGESEPAQAWQHGWRMAANASKIKFL